jgi:hypothetical protein
MVGAPAFMRGSSALKPSGSRRTILLRLQPRGFDWNCRGSSRLAPASWATKAGCPIAPILGLSGRPQHSTRLLLLQTRDDNSVAGKWSQKRSDEWLLMIPQNCHPDRSEPGFPATRHSPTTTCAAFRKESRMKFANATNLDRKSGVAQWRDLRFAVRCGRIPPAAASQLEDHLARQLKNASSAKGARHLLDPRDGTETVGIDEA